MNRTQYDTLAKYDNVVSNITTKHGTMTKGKVYEVTRVDSGRVYFINDIGILDFAFHEYLEKTCTNNNPGTQPNPEAIVEHVVYKFKVGQKVVCINVGETADNHAILNNDLVLGKRYEVLDRDNKRIFILDSNNVKAWYDVERFQSYDGEKHQFENQYQVLSHLLLHPDKRVCIDFKPQIEVGFKDGKLWNFHTNKVFEGRFSNPHIWRKVRIKKYLYAYKFKNREPQVSVSLCRDDSDATSKIAGDSRSQLEWLEMIESSMQEVE